MKEIVKQKSYVVYAKIMEMDRNNRLLTGITLEDNKTDKSEESKN